MIVCEPENIVPFLVPGRLLKIKSECVDWGWGILVSWTKQRINPKKFLMAANKKKQGIDVLSQTENHYILDILLYVKNKLTSENLLQPGNPSEKNGRLGVVPVILHHSNICAVATIQMNLPHNISNQTNFLQIEAMYFEVLKRFEQGNTLPLLDPKEDMEIESKELDDLVSAKAKLAREIDKLDL